MSRSVLVNLLTQQVTVMEGSNVVSTTPARITVHELNTIRVDQKWYTIAETVDEGVHVVIPFPETNVLDDYLTTKQCEEVDPCEY